MGKMRRRAERFGAQLRPEDADALDLDGEVKSITVGGETHRARTVILAMGAAPRYVGVPGEERLLGHGVSACATCDGFFFRDHDIVVVGGGDSATEEAAFRTHSVVSEGLGENAVSGVRVRDTVTGEEDTLDASGLFVAIGHDPRSALVAGQVETDAEGSVRVDTPSTYTNLPGVFACGDLIDKTYQQAVTAAGSGCTASIDAARWLAGSPAPAPPPPPPAPPA